MSLDSVQSLAKLTSTYAQSRGMLLRHVTEVDSCVPVPHSLLPTVIEKRSFDQVRHLAPSFATLIDRASRRVNWLVQTLEPVVRVDDFTRRIMDIYKQVYSNNEWPQQIQMGIHRSDYMLHETSQFQQVEINTIASSFGTLSQLTHEMHHFILNRYGSNALQNLLSQNPSSLSNVAPISINGQLEPSKSKDEIVKLMVEAYNAWKSSIKTQNQPSILFIVQPNERNFCDQRLLEYDLFEKFNIPVIRATLEDVHKHAKINDNTLHFQNVPIAVAYFRSGYSPSDYPSDQEWNARLLIEKSNAIKCPTVGYQLVGTKYIQYIFTLPGVLEDFVSKEEAHEMRQVFTGIYSMTNKEAVSKAIENPHLYVAKPQREGGGNLIYGEKMSQILKEMPEDVRDGYILMERIRPLGQRNWFFKPQHGQVIDCEGVSELGIFSLFLSDGKNEDISNRYGGYLLRTKPKSVEDGGVASGVASMDSLSLV